MGNGDSSLRLEKKSSCVKKEMTIANVPTIPMSVVRSIEKSICKINVLDMGTGTGFFGMIHLDKRSCYGLFTNNHVIGVNDLCSGIGIKCVLGTEGKDKIQLPVDRYCFTCKLLDATFIEVTDQKREEIVSKGYTFMRIEVSEPPAEGEQILIFQHPRGGDLSVGVGVIGQSWGFDIHHKVSTDYGSSGSPLINTRGCVIGIHKERNVRLHCNVAVEMASVVRAIRKDIIKRREYNDTMPSDCTPDWTQPQFDQLERIGLRRVENNLFVSPAERFLGMVAITPIWFYWTYSFWYWTPTNPNSDVVNWMRISPNDGLKVIGGYWHGYTPAGKNIRIINYLKSHPELVN